MELSDTAEYAADRIKDLSRRFPSKITGLCGRCQNSHILKTPRDIDPRIYCHAFDPTRRVPDNVSECNRFEQIGVLGIWDLAKLALDIDITPKKDVGFTASSKGKQ